MKLKSRMSLTLLLIILGAFFLTLIYLAKYFMGSKSFGNLVSVSNLRTDIAQQNQASRSTIDEASMFLEIPATSNVEIREFLTEKFDKKRLRRRRRKQQKVLNETNADSNRALEEQDDSTFNQTLDGEEIARLAKKGRRFRESDPNVKVRYLRECEGVSKVFLYDEHRKKFPELVSISRKMENLNPRRTRITLQEVGDLELGKKTTFLKKFNGGISNLDMYEEKDTTIDVLLNSMATMSITHVTQKSGGTQLKLLVTFGDGSQAVLKPMRFERSQKTNVNHFYFNDFERHTSEIAAFHLDRILGFRRCVPVVGRLLSITQELYINAEADLLKTFFISPAGNICFHGQCKQYCDTSHAICGKPDSLEVSLAALLPSDPVAERQRFRSPWRRSYHKRKKAEWEINNNYCHFVRQQPVYNNTKLLADIVDEAIFDFLAGNMDRHHYEFFKTFGNNSFLLHLDNGRGFGKPDYDEYSILAPLFQCCFLHKTTYRRLVELQHNGSKLSTLMFCSLYNDPLNPVLLDDHLDALDRRLEMILQVIRVCLHKHSIDQVFFSYEDN